MEQVKFEYSENVKKVLLELVDKIQTSYSIVTTNYMKSIKESLTLAAQIIEGSINNPDSNYNYCKYEKKLSSFHWSWPYGITTQELMTLLKYVENEQQFDKLMLTFFTRERLLALFTDIDKMLPRRHKILFRQIMSGFNLKYYSLVNNALFSIIDNLLGQYIKDKGCIKRKGVLKPIIEYYADNYRVSEVFILYELQMLSNNVDLIFEDIRFDKKIDIQSNKKTRRHLSVHGVRYSNSKVESIMLFNTLFALLEKSIYLSPFCDTLKHRKVGFEIQPPKYVIERRIKKILVSST